MLKNSRLTKEDKMKYAISFLLLVAVFLSVGSAAEYQSGQAVYITKKDTLKSDLFAGAETVTISGVLEGDVFAGCKYLEIKGVVEDDVIAGCKELRISSKVGDQVIGFAQSVIIDNEVGGDVLAFAEEVRITKNAHIFGNLHVGTANLNFEGGIVEGKIFGGGGKAYLNGTVLNGVNLELGKVEFGGEYNSVNGTKLKLHDPLEENAEFIPVDLELSFHEKHYFFQSGFFYWSVVSMFVVGLLLILLFKNFSFDLVTYANKNIWKNLGFGSLFFIATPISIVLMAILVVTIPASLILLALYLIIIYLSSLISGVVLGQYLLNAIKKNDNSTNLIWSLVVGVIVISLITKIPMIGWLLGLLFICFGMGTLILFVYQSLSTNKQLV